MQIVRVRRLVSGSPAAASSEREGSVELEVRRRGVVVFSCFEDVVARGTNRASVTEADESSYS